MRSGTGAETDPSFVTHRSLFGTRRTTPDVTLCLATLVVELVAVVVEEAAVEEVEAAPAKLAEDPVLIPGRVSPLPLALPLPSLPTGKRFIGVTNVAAGALRIQLQPTAATPMKSTPQEPLCHSFRTFPSGMPSLVIPANPTIQHPHGAAQSGPP